MHSSLYSHPQTPHSSAGSSSDFEVIARATQASSKRAFRNRVDRPTTSFLAKRAAMPGTHRKRKTQQLARTEVQESEMEEMETVFYREPPPDDFEVLISIGEYRTPVLDHLDLSTMKRIFKDEYATKYLESLGVEPSKENISLVRENCLLNLGLVAKKISFESERQRRSTEDIR